MSLEVVRMGLFKKRKPALEVKCFCGQNKIIYKHDFNKTKSCGCLVRRRGEANPRWAGGPSPKAYKRVHGLFDHPRNHSGRVYEHVVVAEKALGKYLPEGAQVHHVDGDRHNNSPSNLVICQDQKYHHLLHHRAEVIKAGGNPKIEKLCCHYKALLKKDMFALNKGKFDGLSGTCKPCNNNTRMNKFREATSWSNFQFMADTVSDTLSENCLSDVPKSSAPSVSENAKMPQDRFCEPVMQYNATALCSPPKA